MSAKIIENHKIITMEHDLRNDGRYLSEKKQMTLTEYVENSLENGTKLVTLIHLRSIDDKCYKVTEEFSTQQKGRFLIIENRPELRKVETDMSEEEMENFEKDWELFWEPEITKKEIANLHRRFAISKS